LALWLLDISAILFQKISWTALDVQPDKGERSRQSLKVQLGAEHLGDDLSWVPVSKMSNDDTANVKETSKKRLSTTRRRSSFFKPLKSPNENLEVQV
jgi:hypothetical protein